MSEFTIKISVNTAYLAAQSQPERSRFTFSYTISIENCSDISTQLLSRHWIITDANDTVQEVVGDGVVGEQPHIRPGEKYTYSSGSILETNVGTGCGTLASLHGAV